MSGMARAFDWNKTKEEMDGIETIGRCLTVSIQHRINHSKWYDIIKIAFIIVNV